MLLDAAEAPVAAEDAEALLTGLAHLAPDSVTVVIGAPGFAAGAASPRIAPALVETSTAALAEGAAR